jgi:hypothetical protein
VHLQKSIQKKRNQSTHLWLCALALRAESWARSSSFGCNKREKSAGVKITWSQKRQISGYTLQKNSKAINFRTRSNHFPRHRKLTLAFFSRAATTHMLGRRRSEQHWRERLLIWYYFFFELSFGGGADANGTWAACWYFIYCCCSWLELGVGVKSEQPPWEIFTPVFLFGVLNFHYHCNYSALSAPVICYPWALSVLVWTRTKIGTGLWNEEVETRLSLNLASNLLFYTSDDGLTDCNNEMLRWFMVAVRHFQTSLALMDAYFCKTEWNFKKISR